MVSAAAAARKQEQTLRLFLQDIERSIVFGICKNPETTEFFRDHRRRLDDYFAAAKNLLQMLEHPVLASGDLHNRAKSLLVTVHMMLNDNPDKFGQVVIQLISSLEFLLDMNSRSLGLQGQQQVFLLNNMNFVLEQANNSTDLKLILGENWCLQRHVQLDQFLASYVEASWTPVMSSFIITRIPKILWPQQLFDKFNSRFEMTYNVQKTWKVTDPVIRQKLREKITQKVIPLYRMYLESYSEKKQKSARFNVEHLEAQLLEIFEG